MEVMTVPVHEIHHVSSVLALQSIDTCLRLRVKKLASLLHAILGWQSVETRRGLKGQYQKACQDCEINGGSQRSRVSMCNRFWKESCSNPLSNTKPLQDGICRWNCQPPTSWPWMLTAFGSCLEKVVLTAVQPGRTRKETQSRSLRKEEGEHNKGSREIEGEMDRNIRVCKKRERICTTS